MMTPSRQHKLANYRAQFFQGETEPKNLLPPNIHTSWQRCVSSGLNPDAWLDIDIIHQQQLHDLQHQHEALRHSVQAAIETLSTVYAGIPCQFLLIDQYGVTIDVIQTRSVRDQFDFFKISAGTNLQEQKLGTNAPSLVLDTGQAAHVHGLEHFFSCVTAYTCTAVPIHDSSGGLLGILDLSTTTDYHHFHNITLLTNVVQQIENQRLMSEFSQHIILSLHSEPHYLHTPQTGLLAFSLDGYCVGATHTAIQLLNMTHQQLLQVNFIDLFDSSTNYQTGLLSLHTSQDQQFQGLFLQQHHYLHTSPSPSTTYNSKKTKKTTSSLPDEIRSIAGEDAQLAKNIQKAQRAFKAGIPILLRGETGTGKEVIAQTLHSMTLGKKKPFIAVNCAAIPENLIESELFGYAEGAFTGAKKGGLKGKIQQADGGTLFLDEIGDMPLSLQGRLLRVLQERVVTPLGSHKEQAVEIAVICATHRPIQTMIDDQQFREDLYYRLNGFSLLLPPLRQRADFDQLIQQILATHSPDKTCYLEHDILSLFTTYHWPGNVRQLSSILRTAVALLDEEEVLISCEHLSEDILIELSSDKKEAHCTACHTENTDSTKATLQTAELDHIHRVIKEHNGNISAAAHALDISRATIYRKLKRTTH